MVAYFWRYSDFDLSFQSSSSRSGCTLCCKKFAVTDLKSNCKWVHNSHYHKFDEHFRRGELTLGGRGFFVPSDTQGREKLKSILIILYHKFLIVPNDKRPNLCDFSAKGKGNGKLTPQWSHYTISFPGSLILPLQGAVRWETLGTRLVIIGVHVVFHATSRNFELGNYKLH